MCLYLNNILHHVNSIYTMYSALIHIVGISAFKNAVLLLLLLLRGTLIVYKEQFHWGQCEKTTPLLGQQENHDIISVVLLMMMTSLVLMKPS